MVCEFDEMFVNKFPSLKQIAENVKNVETVKSYLDKRPKTKF